MTADADPSRVAKARLVELFEAFDHAIQPSSAEADALFAHLNDLTRALGRVASLHPTGSYARSTAVRNFSDLDVLAVCEVSPFAGSTPGETLRQLGADLQRAGFRIGLSSTTVSIDFGDGSLIDITPATSLGNASADTEGYLVPNPRGDGWTKYFPNQHDLLVSRSVTRLGERFTAVVRMLKWWSKNNRHAWRSYLVESLVAQVFPEGLPSYPHAVETFLKSESVIASADVQSRKVLARAQELATAAVATDLNGPDALLHVSRLWKEVFGDQFPDLAACDNRPRQR